MNLAQYRLKAATQQRNRLLFCLVAAGMLHGGAIVLTRPLILRRSLPHPIQFVVIDQPDALLSSLSNTQASVDSIRSTQTQKVAFPPKVSPSKKIARSPVLLSTRQAPELQQISIPKTSATRQQSTTHQPDAAKDEIWGEYLTTLRRRIYQQWHPTSMDRDRLLKVRFIIDRQGHLTNLELLQSSSDATADQAALQAVQASAPFAHLPIASKEDRLRVTFTFEAPVFSQ